MVDGIFIYFVRADLIFQKSAKKRAEAAEMMEKEMADTEARQEKVDHKLKERIGTYYAINMETFPQPSCSNFPAELNIKVRKTFLMSRKFD